MCPPGQPKRSLNICACTTFQHPVLLQRPSKCRLNLPRLELNPTYKWPPQTAAAPRVGDGARPSCCEVFMDTVMHVKVQNSRHLCWGALCLASRLSVAGPIPRERALRTQIFSSSGVDLLGKPEYRRHALDCTLTGSVVLVAAGIYRSAQSPPTPRPLAPPHPLSDPPTLPPSVTCGWGVGGGSG